MVNCFQGLHNIVVLVMFNCKFTLTHESVLLNCRYSVAEFQQITTVLFYDMIFNRVLSNKSYGGTIMFRCLTRLFSRASLSDNNRNKNV